MFIEENEENKIVRFDENEDGIKVNVGLIRDYRGVCFIDR